MPSDLSNAGLVERAVRSVERTGPRRPRWSAIRDVFAISSIQARVLCARYKLDPDEDVGELGDPDAECARLTAKCNGLRGTLAVLNVMAVDSNIPNTMRAVIHSALSEGPNDE